MTCCRCAARAGDSRRHRRRRRRPAPPTCARRRCPSGCRRPGAPSASWSSKPPQPRRSRPTSRSVAGGIAARQAQAWIDQGVGGQRRDLAGPSASETAGGRHAANQHPRVVLEPHAGGHGVGAQVGREHPDAAVVTAVRGRAGRAHLGDGAQGPGGDRVGGRGRLVARHLDRHEARLEQRVAVPHRAQERRGEGGQEVLIEDEVAQAVDDEVAAVPLGALQHVGVVTDHDAGAGVDGGLGDAAHVVGRRALELVAGVQLHHHQVGAGGEILDLGDRPRR